jgi:hypothetical protein
MGKNITPGWYREPMEYIKSFYADIPYLAGLVSPYKNRHKAFFLIQAEYSAKSPGCFKRGRVPEDNKFLFPPPHPYIVQQRRKGVEMVYVGVSQDNPVQLVGIDGMGKQPLARTT